ncbi:MAG: HAMP domain-containing sensor histidine kinase [Myxococcota bacterium]
MDVLGFAFGFAVGAGAFFFGGVVPLVLARNLRFGAPESPVAPPPQPVPAAPAPEVVPVKAVFDPFATPGAPVPRPVAATSIPVLADWVGQPIALFLVDTVHQIRATTTTAELLFGPGLVGTRFARIVPDWEAAETHRSEKWTSPTGVELGEVWTLDAHTMAGDTVPVRMKRSRAPQGWWVALSDASSEQKQLERLTKANTRLQGARDDALKDSRAKTAYLARVAQGLRTPLNTIVGYGELVAEEVQDRGYDELVADVARINAASGALETILQTVLDWTEVETGRMSMTPVRFELSDVIGEAVEACREAIQANGNTLSFEAVEGLRALGDAKRVGQVVRALLKNAGQYCENGSVTVRLRRAGAQAAISVVDTGKGFEGGELEELFVDFAQRSSDHPTTGTGISLLLAHTFAGMMGGDLRVESPEGEGATFTLLLPAVDENEYAPPMLME